MPDDLLPLGSKFVSADLSKRAKQTLQIVGLCATVLVVGIHYKSDIPDSPVFAEATWNEIAQEFWLGGVARVAVPLFAFTAGLLYFLTFDGTFSCYRRKLGQRCRSVLFPYFIVGSVATVCWLAVRASRGEGAELTIGGFVSTWLLHPPAEQLWFLRDLILLVATAPLLSVCVRARIVGPMTMTGFAAAWFFHVQPFPIIAGWRLLQMETLLFFALGCCASRRTDLIDRATRFGVGGTAALTAAWFALVALRVWMRPDFNLWYVREFGRIDLALHQTSVLCGGLALFALASKIESDRLRRWSGASFFVFLIHEFPLRAAIDRFVERLGDPAESCWLTFPCVVVGCFTFAIWFSKTFPAATSILTGGRTPARAARIGIQAAKRHSMPVAREVAP